MLVGKENGFDGEWFDPSPCSVTLAYDPVEKVTKVTFSGRHRRDPLSLPEGSKVVFKFIPPENGDGTWDYKMRLNRSPRQDPAK